MLLSHTLIAMTSQQTLKVFCDIFHRRLAFLFFYVNFPVLLLIIFLQCCWHCWFGDRKSIQPTKNLPSAIQRRSLKISGTRHFFTSAIWKLEFSIHACISVYWNSTTETDQLCWIQRTAACHSSTCPYEPGWQCRVELVPASQLVLPPGGRLPVLCHHTRSPVALRQRAPTAAIANYAAVITQYYITVE